MTTRVMGIDGSATSTGVCVLSAQAAGKKQDMVWSQQALQIPGFTGIERAVRQVELLDEILVSTEPDMIVIENYAFKNKFTLATLVEVGTCLRLACRRRDTHYIEVSPTQLKKFIAVKLKRGATQKEKKADVAKAVWDLWGYENECDDIVDAFVLAQMGLLVMGEKPRQWASYQLAMKRDLIGKGGKGK